MINYIYTNGDDHYRKTEDKRNFINRQRSKILETFYEKKSTNQTIYTRCRILLNLEEAHLPAMTYDECINACNVSRATIAKLVKLFASGGIEEVLKKTEISILIMPTVKWTAAQKQELLI